MLGDRARVCKQAVKRDKGRDGREEGEQGVEGDTCSDKQDAVATEPLVDAPENVLPALGRDLAGLLGETSSIPLSCDLLFCSRSTRRCAPLRSRLGLTSPVS